MERLENFDNLKGEKSLKINIVRHGPSPYEQPDWQEINTADDINSLGLKKQNSSSEEIAAGKKEAVDIVRQSAEKIAEEIGPDEEVIIWSSPTGRTLETARIISEVLEEKGIKLRKKGLAKEYGIDIFEKLGEVKNFKWSYFAPLFTGGEVEISGQTFNIDKSQTNPDSLASYDYFNSDAIERIPEEVKANWPIEYRKEVESFESFKEITKRSQGVLQRLLSLKDKNYRIIIVTHDAVAGSVIDSYSPGSRLSLNPGDFMTLERKGDDLIATRLGELNQ